MKNFNVCKFPLSDVSKDLTVSCFVLETDAQIMQNKTVLKSHRMLLIDQGQGEFLLNDVPVAFEAGTLLFGFEGETFVLKNGENVRYLYIDFHGERANDLFRRFEIHPHTRKKDGANALIPFCKECLLSTKPENIDLAAESVLLYVFSRLRTSPALQNDTIQEIIKITEESFRDPDLSITSIAKEIGYNPKYLSHFFKEKMHISYSEYLRSYRFKYAVSLFELGIISVKNVAFLCGFSDPLYFSSAFKKHVGISPKEFLRRLQNTKNNTE